MDDEKRSSNTIELAANLTLAWLSNPNVRPSNEDATDFLQKMHATLNSLGGEDQPAAGATAAEHVPAVTIRKSLASPDRIISLIDGKPYSSLKRHLSKHGLTPQQYRERYGLKADYPMVAPAYAEKRRQLAKKIGLGRKRGATVKPAATTKAAASAKPAASRKPANGRRKTSNKAGS